MKPIFITCILVVGCTSSFAGARMVSGGVRSSQPIPNAKFDVKEIIAANTDREEAIQRQKALEFYRANWAPQDPWRLIESTTNYARGRGWVQFMGKVVDVADNGIRVAGVYGEPMEIEYFSSQEHNYKDFWIENFPYQVANDDVIGTTVNYTALEAGTYSYKTVNGGSRTIRKFDYGIPRQAPPPTEEQIAAAKSELEFKQAKAKEKARQSQQAQQNAAKLYQKMASEGNEFGQLHLAECYMNGSGVERDLEKAKTYLDLSAAQGNDQAKELLKKLEKMKNNPGEKPLQLEFVQDEPEQQPKK